MECHDNVESGPTRPRIHLNERRNTRKFPRLLAPQLPAKYKIRKVVEISQEYRFALSAFFFNLQGWNVIERVPEIATIFAIYLGYL